MKPWRKFRAPTGPISPAQKHPATGSGPSSWSTSAGVVVGLAEQALAPAVAGEQQGGVGLGGGQQVAQVLVGGVGVADVELHRPARRDDVADGDGAAALVGAHHVADEEVAPAELGLVSSTTQPMCRPRRSSSRSSSVAAAAVSWRRSRAGLPPSSKMKLRSALVTT